MCGCASRRLPLDERRHERRTRLAQRRLGLLHARGRDRHVGVALQPRAHQLRQRRIAIERPPRLRHRDFTRLRRLAVGRRQRARGTLVVGADHGATAEGEARGDEKGRAPHRASCGTGSGGLAGLAHALAAREERDRVNRGLHDVHQVYTVEVVVADHDDQLPVGERVAVRADGKAPGPGRIRGKGPVRPCHRRRGERIGVGRGIRRAGFIYQRKIVGGDDAAAARHNGRVDVQIRNVGIAVFDRDSELAVAADADLQPRRARQADILRQGKDPEQEHEEYPCYPKHGDRFESNRIH